MALMLDRRPMRSKYTPKLCNLCLELMFAAGVPVGALRDTPNGVRSAFVDGELFFIALKVSRQFFYTLLQMHPTCFCSNQRLAGFG
jgi:hypothetical protein